MPPVSSDADGWHIEMEDAKMLYPHNPTKYICDVVAMI
jgi:hypothetical protein